MSNPIHDAVEPDADPASRDQADRGSLGIHPIVFKTVIAATVWFLAVAWLAFARGAETDYLLVIVTLFFVIFLTLFLLTATYSRGDARWPTKRASFREFLNGTVSPATGDERAATS